MASLYIFDLEGTTGIYNVGGEPHINNIMLLRPGFRQVVQQLQESGAACAIASRAPRHYGEEILKNLALGGVEWPGKAYFKEDIWAELPYKDFSVVYRDFGIKQPQDEVVIIGDFLRFHPTRAYDREMFLSFDFAASPEAFYSNHALNDHPLNDGNSAPVYAVVPQPWTTGNISLDMRYIFARLQEMGKRGFMKGFAAMKSAASPDQLVEDDGLSRKYSGELLLQRYAVLKGHKENWLPLEELL